MAGVLHKTTFAAATLALSFLLGGCATEGYLDPTQVGSDRMIRERAARPDAMSLFPADQAAIGDAALTEILNGTLDLPATVRLAVVPVGQTPSFSGFAPEFAERSRAIDAQFLGGLRDSDRIDYAQYLPQMLTPREVSVPQLREAAARYRADMVLIVHTATRQYKNDRLLGKDRVRAYCDVEAVLVDVRSGTVPFSTNTTESFLATKAGNDLNFKDTIARANQEAIGVAWQRVAVEAAEFMDGLGVSPLTQTN